VNMRKQRGFFGIEPLEWCVFIVLMCLGFVLIAY
jgi:hypothetical protein